MISSSILTCALLMVDLSQATETNQMSEMGHTDTQACEHCAVPLNENGLRLVSFQLAVY
jgi:hypothetical protein